MCHTCHMLPIHAMLHAYPFTYRFNVASYLLTSLPLCLLMPSFPCGQPGCNRTFTQTSDCTKHIHNHHLSCLNIWPNNYGQPQSLYPPITCQQSPRSGSPLPEHEYHQLVGPEMLELIDFNDDNDDNDDFDMNISNHLSPNPHISLSPSCDSPPSDHGMPPPQSPQPEPFVQRVPPRVNHVFHPTINGMSFISKFYISYL